jgi:hypothetical protein
MNRHVIRYFVGLAFCVLCGFWLLTSSSTVESGARNQDAGAAHSSIRLQYQPSQSFQTESEQQLKRAVVVARKRKSNAGTLFNAYLILTNVALANNCDLNKAALTSDSDFALVAILSEKFNEKDGPEGTAIHRILFGQPDQTQPKYLFIASPTNPERLQSIVGNVPYNAREAWHFGWGSGFKVSVIPKGSEQIARLEISHEQGNGWSLYLNHLAAKKEFQAITPNSTTYLVFSREESGPTVRFNHRDKKVFVSGNVPLTMCGLIPEDVPTPFIPAN